MKKKIKLISSFPQLPAAMAVAAALACGSAHASTIDFDHSSDDYAPGTNISVSVGDSRINASNLLMQGFTFGAELGEGAGTLTVNAKDALFGTFRQSLTSVNAQSPASYSTEFNLTGEFKTTSGLYLNTSSREKAPVRTDNSITIKANSIDLYGQSNGLSVESSKTDKAWPNTRLAVNAKANSIRIEGGDFPAIFLSGENKNATETEGTSVKLESSDLYLTGGSGYGGQYAKNAAIYVCKGASLELIGTEPGSKLTIVTKDFDSSSYHLGNAAILNRGGDIAVRYSENSVITLTGGIMSVKPYDASYTANTVVEIGEGSRTVVDGDIVGMDGDVNITARGTFSFNGENIYANYATIDLDLETSGTDSGSITGEMDVYTGTVNMRLAGQNNAYTGLTYAPYDGASVANITLEKGATWNVEDYGPPPPAAQMDPESINKVTTITLNSGRLNLAYRNEKENDTYYRRVRADTLKGDGGTLNFNLVLNSNEEENDRLLLKTFEAGDHTVHVEAHSGFEPIDMQGYLIRADEWKGGTFSADTNKLEAGVFLYNYTVAHRQGETEGQTDWYLTFDKYEPPAPDPEPDPKPEPPLSPSGEAVASLAGMGAQTAMYLAQLSDVRKRLGEVRRGAVEGLWASVGSSGDHISGFRGTGFKQDAYRFNFGFDRKAGEWLLGGTLKAMTADQKTRGTQFQGKGDAHSEGFNLYATWTGNNGSYADFVAGLDRYHEKLSTHMLNGVGVSGAYRNIGLGLSAEVGHQFMSKDAWFIEPQAQLSYYRLWGDDFALSNGMKVSQKNFNGLTGRLGLASGKEFRKADGTEAGQLYARLGIKHELMGDQEIHVNGIRFKDGLLGTRFYYGLGAEWLLAKNVKVFGHVERENGSRYTREFDFNLGVKYAF